MNPPATVSLQSEVKYIFANILGVTPQDLTVSRYERFHQIYGADLAACRQVSLGRLIERRLDVEAIEFFLRTRDPGNLLSRKLWACSYLYDAEAGALLPQAGAAQGVDTPPFSCALLLVWFGIRSGWKWVKGITQVYWYRLI